MASEPSPLPKERLRESKEVLHSSGNIVNEDMEGEDEGASSEEVESSEEESDVKKADSSPTILVDGRQAHSSSGESSDNLKINHKKEKKRKSEGSPTTKEKEGIMAMIKSNRHSPVPAPRLEHQASDHLLAGYVSPKDAQAIPMYRSSDQVTAATVSTAGSGAKVEATRIVLAKTEQWRFLVVQRGMMVLLLAAGALAAAIIAHYSVCLLLLFPSRPP